MIKYIYIGRIREKKRIDKLLYSWGFFQSRSFIERQLHDYDYLPLKKIIIFYLPLQKVQFYFKLPKIKYTL